LRTVFVRQVEDYVDRSFTYRGAETGIRQANASRQLDVQHQAESLARETAGNSDLLDPHAAGF
jgi:hypothetical protein